MKNQRTLNTRGFAYVLVLLGGERMNFLSARAVVDVALRQASVDHIEAWAGQSMHRTANILCKPRCELEEAVRIARSRAIDALST